MDKVTVIACACVAVLFILRPSATSGGKAAASLAAWCAGVLFGAWGLAETMQLLGYCPASPDNGYLAFNVNQVRRSRDHLPQNVILLDGGSYGARGLNYQELENDLRARGYSVMVLQFCNPGASRFERLYTLKQFLRHIGRQTLNRLNDRHVLLLSEAHHDYDLDPVAQFSKNLYSSRTLAYLQPSIMLEVLHASQVCRKFDGGTELSYPLKLDLIKHGLLNAFNVGFLHRSEILADVQETEPVFELSSNQKQPGNPKVTLAQLVDELCSASNLPRLDLRWTRVIDSELRASGLKYERAHFATPSRNSTHLRYLARYQRTFTAEPFLWFAKDRDFLNSLDDPRCWYDAGHLSSRGAELCTHWFAGKIADSGLLVR